MNKKNNVMTAEEKKAARAAYAKAYYAKLKAKKALNDKPAKAKAKNEDKPKAKLAKHAVAVKKNVVKKNVAKEVTNKYSMKSAQKLFDQIRKPLSNVKKLTKEYGKLMTEALKSKDPNAGAKVAKMFSYAGFEFNDGLVKITIQGKVKTPVKKTEVAKVEVQKTDVPVAAPKKRGRKPKNAIDELLNATEKTVDNDEIDNDVDDTANPDQLDEDLAENDDQLDEEPVEDQIRDYQSALNEMEEEMIDNGDWEN